MSLYVYVPIHWLQHTGHWVYVKDIFLAKMQNNHSVVHPRESGECSLWCCKLVSFHSPLLKENKKTRGTPWPDFEDSYDGVVMNGYGLPDQREGEWGDMPADMRANKQRRTMALGGAALGFIFDSAMKGLHPGRKYFYKVVTWWMVTTVATYEYLKDIYMTGLPEQTSSGIGILIWQLWVISIQNRCISFCMPSNVEIGFN